MGLFNSRASPVNPVLYCIQEPDYVVYITLEYKNELEKNGQLTLIEYRRDAKNRLTFFYRFRFK